MWWALNWLDIIITLIIVWNAWIGMRTGLVGGVAGLLATFLGLAAAFNFYRPLADVVNLKWNMVSVIGKWIPGLTSGAGKKPPGSTDFLLPFKGAPGAESLLPGSKGALNGLFGLGDSVTRLLAAGILDIICFIVIFLVVSRVVVLLGSLLGKASRIFFLGTVDRLGGTLLGTVKGAVISLVMVALALSVEAPAAFLAGGYGFSSLSLALHKSLLVPYFVKALVIFNLKFPGWGI